MYIGRLLVIAFSTSLCWPTRLLAAFVSGFRWSSTSLVLCLVLVDFPCLVSFLHLLWSHFSTCLAFLLDLLRGSTCVGFRLASCFDLLRLDLSTSFRSFWLRFVCYRGLWIRALAASSLGGLIIFRMLGAYVDSLPGTLIPALWVFYHRWTSVSLSALWSFILAPPVGSSLCLNVVAMSKTYFPWLVL